MRARVLSFKPDLCFCEKHMSEEQQPNEVKQTDSNTSRDCYEDCENQGDEALRFQPSGPTNEDFYNPVYTRDQQQDKLNQEILSVEPTGKTFRFLCHTIIPPKCFLGCSILYVLYFVNREKEKNLSKRQVFFLIRH